MTTWRPRIRDLPVTVTVTVPVDWEIRRLDLNLNSHGDRDSLGISVESRRGRPLAARATACGLRAQEQNESWLTAA